MALFKFPFRPIWMLIPMLALLASALISIAVYGSIPRAPAGLKVEDWAVGGMNYGEFERQLAEKKARSLERPIALTVSGGIGAGTQVRTLQRLGLHTEEGQIQRRLRQLREGSPFRRAVNRWKARSGVWAWPRGIADEPLQAALQQAFPQVYARRPVNAKRIFTENDTISYTAEMPVERVDENKSAGTAGAAAPHVGLAQVELRPSAMRRDSAQGGLPRGQGRTLAAGKRHPLSLPFRSPYRCGPSNRRSRSNRCRPKGLSGKSANLPRSTR
ncbi:hypothetical protein LJK87_36655 [Paenibacillus sp. P25]|nr:hypothetical protein LJK87_36655 [Paenibacillus sp. P25]